MIKIEGVENKSLTKVYSNFLTQYYEAIAKDKNLINMDVQSFYEFAKNATMEPDLLPEFDHIWEDYEPYEVISRNEMLQFILNFLCLKEENKNN